MSADANSQRVLTQEWVVRELKAEATRWYTSAEDAKAVVSRLIMLIENLDPAELDALRRERDKLQAELARERQRARQAYLHGAEHGL